MTYFSKMLASARPFIMFCLLSRVIDEVGDITWKPWHTIALILEEAGGLQFV